MAYAGWTAVIQDDRGNIQPGATVEVRNINTGSLAVLYADREGTVGLGNPFQADSEGYATFYARGAEYRITATRGAWTTEWPYVPVGTTQGVDLADLALGLDYDVQVNTLPERDAYDGEPEGFSVLVSDVGDGRGAVYTRTDVPGEWSDPAFITGTPGPATNISIGTVDTVDYGEGSSATMTGAPPAQVLNLELERGAPGRIENFQGPWSGSATYASGDIVESGGSLYMAMVADPAAVPPSAGWELFLPGSSVADGTVTGPKLADGAVSISKTDGTYARVTFDTVAQLLTGVVAGKTLGYSTGLVVSPGEIVHARGFRYEVAASDATLFALTTNEGGYHVQTAGGVKLIYKPQFGMIDVNALGAYGAGENYTAEVQLALDFGATFETTEGGAGATVIFPAGEYVLDTVVMKKSVNLLGMGRSSIIKPGPNIPITAGGGAVLLSLSGGDSTAINTSVLESIYGVGNAPPLRLTHELRGITISGLFFHQTDMARENIKAMWFTGIGRASRIENCGFRGFVTGANANEPTSGAITIAGSWVFTIDRCFMYGRAVVERLGTGICISGGRNSVGEHFGSTVCNHFEIKNSGIYQFWEGINIRRANAFSIWNNDIEYCQRGIRIGAGHGGVISGGNYLENILGNHISIGGSSLSGDSFSSNLEIVGNYHNAGVYPTAIFLSIGSAKGVVYRNNHYNESNPPTAYIQGVNPGASLSENCFLEVPTTAAIPGAINRDKNGFFIQDINSTQVAGDRTATGTNGTWKRHPDGTLECFHTLPVTNGDATWTYQLAFVGELPVISLTALDGSTSIRDAHVTTRSLSSCGVRVVDSAGNGVTGNVMARAIGRWRS